MQHTNDELAREGLKLVAVAARVTDGCDRLTRDDLQSVGHEELTVSLALYSPECGPWRLFLFARLRNAMRAAVRKALREPKSVAFGWSEPADGDRLVPLDETLTTGQMAAACSCSTTLVGKWIDKGWLRGFRLPRSAHRRVRLSEFVAFCREHGLPCVAPQPGASQGGREEPPGLAGPSGG